MDLHELSDPKDPFELDSTRFQTHEERRKFFEAINLLGSLGYLNKPILLKVRILNDSENETAHFVNSNVNIRFLDIEFDGPQVIPAITVTRLVSACPHIIRLRIYAVEDFQTRQYSKFTDSEICQLYPDRAPAVNHLVLNRGHEPRGSVTLDKGWQDDEDTKAFLKEMLASFELNSSLEEIEIEFRTLI
jgi:hypothetical protein